MCTHVESLFVSEQQQCKPSMGTRAIVLPPSVTSPVSRWLVRGSFSPMSSELDRQHRLAAGLTTAEQPNLARLISAIFSSCEQHCNT